LPPGPEHAPRSRAKYPTAAKAAVGAPEKPFQGSDLDTPCRETKVRAPRTRKEGRREAHPSDLSRP
jgi:hypothetical protein